MPNENLTQLETLILSLYLVFFTFAVVKNAWYVINTKRRKTSAKTQLLTRCSTQNSQTVFITKIYDQKNENEKYVFFKNKI